MYGRANVSGFQNTAVHIEYLVHVGLLNYKMTIIIYSIHHRRIIMHSLECMANFSKHHCDVRHEIYDIRLSHKKLKC